MKIGTRLVLSIFLLFLLCLGASILFKKLCGVEGDYLSAFSTLIAAFVAYTLYSDWKIEHKFQLLENYHEDIKKSSSDLYSSVLKIYRTIISFENSIEEDRETYKKSAIQDCYDFYSNLDKSEKTLRGYLDFLSRLNKNNYVKETEDITRFYLGVHFDIYRELLKSFDKYDFNNFKIELMKSEEINIWRKKLIEYEYFGTRGLAEFYLNYLDSNN
ncbi:hypothetical protein EXD98_16060 [Acinetobacter pittii]|uniref:Uncharacterized protein n=1 Tax=Acinetobacter pittii TaxID=48296 RepID=A0AAE8G7P0_ACIPI|nr:hypothetical protein [Acinetobacter pittii]RZH26685.1 hypothetical protein EXD98_16060 [Acinetobacter pittii]